MSCCCRNNLRKEFGSGKTSRVENAEADVGPPPQLKLVGRPNVLEPANFSGSPPAFRDRFAQFGVSPVPTTISPVFLGLRANVSGGSLITRGVGSGG